MYIQNFKLCIEVDVKKEEGVYVKLKYLFPYFVVINLEIIGEEDKNKKYYIYFFLKYYIYFF